MIVVVALGYWFGAALLWLPIALMLHAFRAERRELDHVMAGLVLATIWPVSTPIVGGLYAAIHLRRRPVDVPEAALVRV